MKAKFLLLVVLLSPCVAVAQATSGDGLVEAVRHPGWDLGLSADYVNGIGTRTDVHAAGIDLRVGRVLTDQMGSGLLRGTFEYDVDLTPAEIYHLPAYTPRGSAATFPAKNYFTAGFNPLMAKWNFTRGDRWVPYVAVEGGLVFSNGDLPQGDTSSVNFTSGAAFGLQHFVSPRGAWTFQGKIFHLSNASLGAHNPGINAALQFKLGYTWFKR